MIFPLAPFGRPFVLRPLALLLVFVPALLLTACTGDSGKQEAAAEMRTSGGKTGQKKAPLMPGPLRVRVVVPYGGNMPGFMGFLAPRGINTTFQQRVGRLINEVNASPEVTDRAFYLVDQTVHVTAVPVQELAHRINGTSPTKYGAGIGVADLLRNTLALPNANKVVSVIITDLVDHSPNRRMLAALEGEIALALAPLRRDNLTASVYAETSAFYGEYFAAFQQTAKPQVVKGPTLPYYLIVIGPAAQVARFNQKVLREAPTQQAHFNVRAVVPFEAVTRKLPATFNTKGVAYQSAPHEVTVEDLGDEAAEFTIGLNLATLPSALRAPSALQKLTGTAPNAQVSLVGAPHLLTAVDLATPALAPYTHTVRVRVKQQSTRATTLTLALPAPGLPSWVANQTTADDTKPALKTYQLQTILTGMQQAVGASAPSVLTCRLRLVNADLEE